MNRLICVYLRASAVKLLSQGSEANDAPADFGAFFAVQLPRQDSLTS